MHHLLAAALSLLAGAACAGMPGPQRGAPAMPAPQRVAPPMAAMPVPVPVPVPIPNVRQAVEQYHPGAMPPPRQLSAGERAELRRQLIEYSQPARRR